MADELIHPNWHVLLIHFPIALLTLGLLVELLSFISPRSGFRAAGRWMILLGALLAVPTLTAGIYAFRDVVAPTATPDEHWHEIVAESNWSPQQWEFMKDHILYNSIAVALFLVAVALWLANSDDVRRKLYWPLLAALVAGDVLLGIGAWHGGEMVYRYGTAVGANSTEAAQLDSAQEKIKYVFPPLQAHVVFAGLALAAIVAALALMIRRWEKPAIAPGEPDVLERLRPSDPLAQDPAADRIVRSLRSSGPYGEEEVDIHEPPRVFPGRFYVLAFALAVIAAVFGDWSVTGDLASKSAWRMNLDMLRDPDHRRLLAHVICGVAVIVLPLILAAFVRFARRQHLVASLVALLLLLAFAAQLWLGILMLYDAHEGPLTRFARPGEAANEEDEHGAATTRNAPAATRGAGSTTRSP